MKYYAEYLSNLNYVGIYIEFDSVYRTKVQSVDPETLVLSSPGSISDMLKLPVPVSSTSRDLANTEVRIRLQPLAKQAEVDDTYAATQFTLPVCICGTSLAQGKDLRWKRLPSEHWAELMDLWHCHKPAETVTSDQGMYDLVTNGFHPKVGLAYYSDTYYLLHRLNIIEAGHAFECPILTCAEKAENEVKLWKWDLSEGPVSPIIRQILVDLVDAHAMFTFEVNEKLLLWVLNASVRYTITGSTKPQRGTKVCYGESSTLRHLRPDPEPVTIPSLIFAKLAAEMESANQSLPNQARKMGTWKVALL